MSARWLALSLLMAAPAGAAVAQEPLPPPHDGQAHVQPSVRVVGATVRLVVGCAGPTKPCQGRVRVWVTPTELSDGADRRLLLAASDVADVPPGGRVTVRVRAKARALAHLADHRRPVQGQGSVVSDSATTYDPVRIRVVR